MKLVIDMNLSPAWVDEFKSHNIDAVHWSSVGKFNAPDSEIVNWAKENDYVIFTHDLDFGTTLALSKEQKPSVVQVRTQDVSIKNLSKIVIPTIKKYRHLLDSGALLAIDENKQRVRILPL